MAEAPIACPELDSVFQMVPLVPPGAALIALTKKLAPER